jgi:hypothetical protein
MLILTESLVAENMEVGIFIAGVDADITATVVRDTLPRGIDSTGGRGVDALCDFRVDACGTLTVTGSLVAGNSEYGIVTYGHDAVISSTVVRDTQSRLRDGVSGRGIVALCNDTVNICGTLTVTGSSVAGNRDVGIFSAGANVTINSTVIRDTLSQDRDQTGGSGIAAQCHPDMGRCGSVTLTGSLVAGNRKAAIFASGADIAVTSTVVRGTLPLESDETSGRGISTQCNEMFNTCGSLTVDGSLVDGNRELGIFAAGGDVAVTSTVVRDTLPQQSDGESGRGIEAICDYRVGVCGSFAVTGSLVAGNRDSGILASGVDTTITSTTVRDTEAQESDGTNGRGIGAQCDARVGTCGSLAVTETLVTRSRNTGIFIGGLVSTLHGVAVTHTRPNEAGDWRDDFGQGIWALCSEAVGACGTLEMTSCLVESNYTAGLAVQGVPGFIESSVINSVVPRPSDDAFGYGIQLEGLEYLQPLNFEIRSCVIRAAALAGILYSHARGMISGTSTGGGQYAVVANVGSSPEIADHNDLSGTVQDGLYWGSMDPSPAPRPALPTD